MALQEEVENALLSQATALMEVISVCRLIASGPMTGTHPSAIFEFIREARLALNRAEALQAALYSRARVSWDVMASRAGGTQVPGPVSKQALHRRLAFLGEELFEEAQEESDYYLREIEKSDGHWFPDLPEILVAYADKAAEIVDAKSGPRWWEYTDQIQE